MEKNAQSLVGRVISGYEIVAVLGGGGMGTVYRARKVNTTREVAMKIINVDLADSEQFVTRFRREAEAIAALEHPHIIPIFDYGQDSGLTFIVMALKMGGSLSDIIKGPRPPLPDAVRYVGEIASALDYAHSRGIFHRDLKPANVLLDEERNTFLTDFGIARRAGETKLTAQGMVVGSPVYMAPEAWRGEEPSSHTDVYSLSVILYELLTGQPPFYNKAPAQLMIMHIQNPVPSPLTYRPELPQAVEAVVMKGLAKERSDRFASATELAQYIKAALGRSARPVTPPQVDLRQAAGDQTLRPPMSPSVPMAGPAPAAPTQASPRRQTEMQDSAKMARRPQAAPQPAPAAGNSRTMMLVMGGLIIVLLLVIIVLLLAR